MTYKTKFPEGYARGTVSRSFTLSKEAFELMADNDIDNESAFVNDLVVGALRNDSYWRKKALSDYYAAKEALEKLGFTVTSELKEGK